MYIELIDMYMTEKRDAADSWATEMLAKSKTGRRSDRFDEWWGTAYLLSSCKRCPATTSLSERYRFRQTARVWRRWMVNTCNPRDSESGIWRPARSAPPIKGRSILQIVLRSLPTEQLWRRAVENDWCTYGTPHPAPSKESSEDAMRVGFAQ